MDDVEPPRWSFRYAASEVAVTVCVRLDMLSTYPPATGGNPRDPPPRVIVLREGQIPRWPGPPAPRLGSGPWPRPPPDSWVGLPSAPSARPGWSPASMISPRCTAGWSRARTRPNAVPGPRGPGLLRQRRHPPVRLPGRGQPGGCAGGPGTGGRHRAGGRARRGHPRHGRRVRRRHRRADRPRRAVTVPVRPGRRPRGQLGRRRAPLPGPVRLGPRRPLPPVGGGRGRLRRGGPAAVGVRGRRLRPGRRGAGRVETAHGRRRPGRGRAGVGGRSGRPGFAEPGGSQRPALLRGGGHPPVGRPHHQLRPGVEIHQHPPLPALPGTIPRRRHPGGRLRAQRREPVGDRPPAGGGAPRRPVAGGRAHGASARTTPTSSAATAPP